jgi:hypothetical protein
MSRQGSFVDLPMVAIPGLATRVSIRGTTAASQDDLPGLFSAQQDDEVDFDEMAFEGGWTWALFLSASSALLTALQFGYNNANMNTPAAVMRAALSVPERTPESCNPSLPLPGNDSVWGFCVSVFCLSALIGAAEGGRLADRWGRRIFLLLNSFIYVIAGALEAAAALPSCESADPCNPQPCIAGLSILMAGRVVTGIACGASTVVVPMYLGEIAPPHLRGQLGSAFLLTAVTAMLIAQATHPHLVSRIAPPPQAARPHSALPLVSSAPCCPRRCSVSQMSSAPPRAGRGCSEASRCLPRPNWYCSPSWSSHLAGFWAAAPTARRSSTWRCCVAASLRMTTSQRSSPRCCPRESRRRQARARAALAAGCCLRRSTRESIPCATSSATGRCDGR